MLKEKSLHLVGKEGLKHKVDEGLRPKEEHMSHEHIKHHTNKKPEHEHHLEHKKPISEEIEMLINLCGSKEELKEVLVHINHTLIDMPKEIKTEVKIKKLK